MFLDWEGEEGGRARSAIAWREPVEKRSWMLYVAKRAWNCLTRELRGSVRIDTSWFKLRGERATVMGIRPNNSGIRP